jgi:hypothetical protein
MTNELPLPRPDLIEHHPYVPPQAFNLPLLQGNPASHWCSGTSIAEVRPCYLIAFQHIFTPAAARKIFAGAQMACHRKSNGPNLHVLHIACPSCWLTTPALVTPLQNTQAAGGRRISFDYTTSSEDTTSLCSQAGCKHAAEASGSSTPTRALSISACLSRGGSSGGNSSTGSNTCSNSNKRSSQQRTRPAPSRAPRRTQQVQLVQVQQQAAANLAESSQEEAQLSSQAAHVAAAGPGPTAATVSLTTQAEKIQEAALEAQTPSHKDDLSCAAERWVGLWLPGWGPRPGSHVSLWLPGPVPVPVPVPVIKL